MGISNTERQLRDNAIDNFLANATFSPVEGEEWGFWEHGNILVQGWPDRQPHRARVEDEIVEAAYYAGLEAIGAW